MKLQVCLTMIAATLIRISSLLALDRSPSDDTLDLSLDSNRSQPGLLAPESILIAAHRGGYAQDKDDRAPENSVANILNCERNGYAVYETDVQRTKDGHFVILHDPRIDRETTGIGRCCELNLADVKSLFKRYRDLTVSEERVATLSEFLNAGKGHVIFKADLKPGVSRYFEDIMQRVEQADAVNGIVFRVPYREADRFARYQAEGVFSSRGRLMFMVSTKEQVDDIVARFESLSIQINLDRSTPVAPNSLELIQYATNLGLLVEVHDYGAPKDTLKLIEAGARMFHTKKPAELKAFLFNQH